MPCLSRITQHIRAAVPHLILMLLCMQHDDLAYVLQGLPWEKSVLGLGTCMRAALHCRRESIFLPMTVLPKSWFIAAA